MLWTDTMSKATLINSEIQSIIKVGARQHPGRCGAGGTESSTLCSNGRQEKTGTHMARRRVSKPIPTVTHFLQQATPPNSATPRGSIGTIFIQITTVVLTANILPPIFIGLLIHQLMPLPGLEKNHNLWKTKAATVRDDGVWSLAHLPYHSSPYLCFR